jgi:hypothetical protein
VTDSRGVVAFLEPGLMDQDVFFFVASHGYEYPADGFGMRGTTLRVRSGGAATLRIERRNIAERLYRITGEGIYRDSALVGDPVPIRQPLLNGQVVGQDSALTVRYRNKIYWFWGDTNRPSYPLGNFQMSGATAPLPGQNGLDPSVGIDLTYFVDAKTGFSRPMARCPSPAWSGWTACWSCRTKPAASGLSANTSGYAPSAKLWRAALSNSTTRRKPLNRSARRSTSSTRCTRAATRSATPLMTERTFTSHSPTPTCASGRALPTSGNLIATKRSPALCPAGAGKGRRKPASTVMRKAVSSGRGK